ncbi:hypothetical protein [Sorangium sp. So ce131]|uniref:hypothetical protein n=1 Tax=Sorangium sp. So ce131 TaxID=3133282 RepID=UPI003F63E926
MISALACILDVRRDGRWCPLGVACDLTELQRWGDVGAWREDLSAAEWADLVGLLACGRRRGDEGEWPPPPYAKASLLVWRRGWRRVEACLDVTELRAGGDVAPWSEELSAAEWAQLGELLAHELRRRLADEGVAGRAIARGELAPTPPAEDEAHPATEPAPPPEEIGPPDAEASGLVLLSLPA